MTNHKKSKKSPSEESLDLLIKEYRIGQPRTLYEKFCRFSQKLRMSPPKKIRKKLEKDIVFSTLNVTPRGVFSGAILSLLIVGCFSILFSLLIKDLSIMVILFILPLGAFYYVYSYPNFRAQVLKVQTGDEGIKIILYMVIYLKLHPNFVGAVNFAASHVKGPLSSDLQKAMWEVHASKYPTVEEALSFHMAKWVIWNEDFVRSLSILRGVLKEPNEERREQILKKSLSFLLTKTHRKMRSYVEGISGPINILHFMGMLLPVMGLIMFPMISMFLHQTINPFFLAVGYTVILPIIIYFLMNRILLKRPSAFIYPDISKHPDLPPPKAFSLKIGKTRLFMPILPLVIVVGLIIMFYGIIHFMDLYTKLIYTPTKVLRMDILKGEAEMSVNNLLSAFSVSGGFGIMLMLYFYLKSFQRIKIRNEIKNIESEFQIGLFSIGNYLSEGYPIENSLQKSLDECEKLGMEGRPIFSFFSRLLYNIKSLGVTFKKALFGKKHGVLRYFPSVLIHEIMEILSDAAERSTRLLGEISKTIGSYLEDLDKIEAKIKELLEDVRAGIKMQCNLIVPLVCGVTGSLGIFILNMLKLLSCQLGKIEESFGLETLGGASMGVGSLLNELVGDFTRVMPMTLLQVIVGAYAFEMVVLFAMLLNGIENGFDDVSRNHLIAKSLMRAILVYTAVSVLALFMFHGIIVSIIETSGGTFVCD